MKKWIGIVVWLCALMGAPPGSAAILDYNIVVNGTFVGTPPFGLPDPPGTLTAKLRVDNTKTDKTGVIDFEFVTGTKTWTEAFTFGGPPPPFPTQLTFTAGVLTAFTLSFLDSPAALILTEVDMALTDDMQNSSTDTKTIFCRGCVDFSVAAAATAPVPGTLALLVGTVVAAVGFARRRKALSQTLRS